MNANLGAVFYRGPSLLNGELIVGVLTGLVTPSHNSKTGPMVQAWILRPDLPPMEAKRQNLDDAICGDCTLRGHDGVESTCYVTPWLGPNNVYQKLAAGAYLEATPAESSALVEGLHIRLGAYGDPAAVPFEIWAQLLTTAAGWVGYSHQWQRPDCDPRLRSIVMASVDTVEEYHRAHAAGWRTFRVRADDEPVLAGECICPASAEADHRTTCQACQLCRGLNRPARSVAIIIHGKPGSNVAVFYRHRALA